MPRSVRRWLVLSGLAVCAVLGGPITAAHADNNALRATLNVYGPKILRDENAVKSGINGYAKGKARSLVRALKHEVADLHALRAKLTSDSASTKKGAKAKTDILKGLGLIATAYRTLRKDILAAHGGAVPAAEVNAAVRVDQHGVKLNKTGLRLLKHAG